jgi:hypothetical protein
MKIRSERVDFNAGRPALYAWTDDGRVTIVPLVLGLAVARALVPTFLALDYDETARFWIPKGLGSKPRKPGRA